MPASLRFAALLVLSLASLLTIQLQFQAAAIIPPENLGALAVSSDAVILGEALGSCPTKRGSLPFTRTEFHVLEGMKGGYAVGDRLSVSCPGGESEAGTWLVPGSPEFGRGEVYLLFLRELDDGSFFPSLLSWGLMKRALSADGGYLMEQLDGAGLLLAGGGASTGEPHRLTSFSERPLLAHLSRVSAGDEMWDERRAGAILSGGRDELLSPPSICAFMNSGGYNVRAKLFDTGGSATIYGESGGDPSISGGGFSQLQAAIGEWMGVPGTILRLIYGGAKQFQLNCTSGTDYPPSGTNIVIFNDPCSDIPDLSGCAGVLGLGGPWFTGTHTFDGATWKTAVSWFVLLNSGAGCVGEEDYKLVLEHELGHGLGFNHVSDPTALMYSLCCHPLNATDTTCLRYLYPGSTSQLIASGQASPSSGTAPLYVSFSGSASGGLPPYSFNWNFGDGSAQSQQYATHTYQAGGTFTWTLTVTDSAQVTAGASGTITVTAPALCTISCQGSAMPGSNYAPASVKFSGTSNLHNCSQPASYEWDFGDGSAGSAEQNPSHLYSNPGTYNWRLTVSAEGKSCVSDGSFTLSRRCSLTCSASASPSSGAPPLLVSFSSSHSASGCSAEPSFLWAFGDGGSSSERNPSHLYQAEGNYLWSLTVSADGVYCTGSGSISSCSAEAKPGDCDGDGSVSIGEVQKAINMFLGLQPPSCGVDRDGDGQVGIGELQKVINAFLGRC